jgi:MFS family permease
MKKKLGNAARDTFRSLHTRNFRLFFTGQLISQVGNWLTLVAQTLLVYRLTDSGVALGILMAAQFGPILILGPWSGLVADRSDKRKLLLIVQSIAMLQSFALAALAFTGHPPLLAIYGVAFVGGITLAFDNPARRAFVTEMVEEDDINNAVSLNSALMTASRVVGPAVAGLLVITAGFGWCFAIDGISYLAVLYSLWRMRPSELHRGPVTPKAKGQIREGLRYAKSVRELWVPLTMMAIVGTLAYNFQVVFPLFASRDLGAGEDDFVYTALFSIVSIGALIGALIAARRKVIDIHSVGAAAIGYGAALMLMTFAPNRWVAYAIGVLVGLGSIAFLTASTAIVQIKSDPHMRGRVLALQAMLFLGCTPIGGLITGSISQQWGARYGVAVGAVAALGAGAWGILLDRHQTKVPIGHDAAVLTVEDALAELERDDLPIAAAGP